MTNTVFVDSKHAQKFVIDLFTTLGMPEKDATILSDILVDSDLRGVMTHGIARTAQYVTKVKNGSLQATFDLKIQKEWDWGGVLDAGHGFGHVAAYQGMNWVIEKAERNGIGVALISMSNHIGMAAYYPLMAAEKDMIGFIASNTSPLMAPWGGSQSTIGNNPFSIAAPTGSTPIVLDIACSEAARGKVLQAKREGKDIPLGWALDQHGHPTTNSSEAALGTMLPFGEHKGYGLAIMVDILTGMLSGHMTLARQEQNYRSPSPSNLSQFLVAININHFIPHEEAKANFRQYIERLKSTPPAAGFDGVRMPGENGFKTKKERLSTGIPYDRSTIELMNELAKEAGIEQIVTQ